MVSNWFVGKLIFCVRVANRQSSCSFCDFKPFVLSFGISEGHFGEENGDDTMEKHRPVIYQSKEGKKQSGVSSQILMIRATEKVYF